MISKNLKILILILIFFSVVIIIGDCFLYLNYQIKYKYEVDLVSYKQEKKNSAEINAISDDIKGILNLSIIVFTYAVSILVFLISILNKTSIHDISKKVISSSKYPEGHFEV